MLAGCSGTKLRESQLTVSQRAEAEAGRDAACDTLRRFEPGMFIEIQPGDSGPVHAFANKEFYEVQIYAKETALKAVAICYLDANRPEQYGVVIVHDGESRKVIGRFDLSSGLTLD